MRAKLTVIIPCKDEQRNIRACVESVRGIADEIIVADSGSKDQSLEIVRQIGGCKVIEREYVNSANFKNWAIPQAKYEWILIVDADERVTDEVANEIREILDAPPENIDGYWIYRLNHFLGYPIRYGGWGNDKVLRLFRQSVGRYQQRWVHAEVELEKSRVSRLKNKMIHYTTWSSEHYLKKLDRYATWGALNLRDEGQAPSVARIFLHFPVRFLQLYVLKRGFLDGLPGFQVCMMLAFYGLLKQFRLWEQHHKLPAPDIEPMLEQQDDTSAVIVPFRRPTGEPTKAFQPSKLRAA
ncbi:MAG: glycosyltransferase family 2 protein [Pirellulales bacterium]